MLTDSWEQFGAPIDNHLRIRTENVGVGEDMFRKGVWFAHKF